jgi:sugar/nucleoside kinase (ribokinase family)
VSRYDYVAVGHVTRDVLDDGKGGKERSQPGGTAFYSALQAARLGLRALIVTQGVSEEIESLLAPWGDELEVRVTPAERTTTLLTRGAGTERTQHLLAWAGEIVDPTLPRAGIVHLAPVAREISPRSIDLGGSDDFVITPQGLLRRWPARSGEIHLAALEPARSPVRFAAAVISEHELPFCASLLHVARECGACVAVTAGARPPTLRLADGRELAGPAPPAVEALDDLGAGDVFAAAFFVALHEGRDAHAAAAFANAAAAVRVSGHGAQALGTRGRVKAMSAENRRAAAD